MHLSACRIEEINQLHWHDLLADLAGFLVTLFTAVGVWLAYRQLRQTCQQARISFEDSLSGQYRSLLAQLPVHAMLGEQLTEAELNAHLGVFYRYFDLSNEQAFLHSRGRIGDETWADWADGIRQNFQLPAFRTSWARVRNRKPDSFDDLAKLVGEPPEAYAMTDSDTTHP